MIFAAGIQPQERDTRLATAPTSARAMAVNQATCSNISIHLQEFRLNIKFEPTSPAWLKRYTRDQRKIFRNLVGDLNIPPLATMPSNTDPPSWKKHVHPEGVAYFEAKREGKVDVFTDANLEISETLTALTSLIEQFDAFVDNQGLNLGKETELVLELENLDGVLGRCYYYLADPETKTVFWLETVRADALQASSNIVPSMTTAHIQLELESQYWYHCSLFPNTREIKEELVKDLRDMVMCARYVASECQYSTIESTEDKLKVILEAISAAEKHINDFAPGLEFILSSPFHHRFINFHGHPSVRLFRDQMVYHETPTSQQASYTFKLLSPVLFFASQFHLEILRDMYTDDTLCASVVEETIEYLNDEWKGLILNANVLLNASVALSARSGVGSVVQMSGYVAIAMSTGSILLGLILVRQNRTKKKGQLDHALEFMDIHSPQILAMIYSLPYALLMWAVIAFVVAFAALCFTPSNKATRTILGVMCAIVAILIICCILYSWSDGRDFTDRNPDRRRWWQIFRLQRARTCDSMPPSVA
ncbi:hypothetical protein AB1N83_012390 [Pleurotus pulmonarius]